MRSNEIYNVYDLKELSKLTLSLTELHFNQHTTGHSHIEEEIYIFIKGKGMIELDDNNMDCKEGDIFTIPSGVFHKVYNMGKRDLKFLCVFERYER